MIGTKFAIIRSHGNHRRSLPIVDARRAVMRARATFDRRAGAFAREERVESSLSVDRLADYIDRFVCIVEAYAALGATHVQWY